MLAISPQYLKPVSAYSVGSADLVQLDVPNECSLHQRSTWEPQPRAGSSRRRPPVGTGRYRWVGHRARRRNRSAEATGR